VQKKTLVDNLKTNKKAIVASTPTDAKRNPLRVEPPREKPVKAHDEGDPD
jgi:hypothetical protein